MTYPTNRPAIAALATLIVLQLIMLGALFAKTPPHPPVAVAPFGIAPFLAASLAVAVAAIISGPLTSRAGLGLSLLAAAMALVSYGPQKFFDAQFPLIWPSVIAGQIAVVVIVSLVFQCVRRNPAAG